MCRRFFLANTFRAERGLRVLVAAFLKMSAKTGLLQPRKVETQPTSVGRGQLVVDEQVLLERLPREMWLKKIVVAEVSCFLHAMAPVGECPGRRQLQVDRGGDIVDEMQRTHLFLR